MGPYCQKLSGVWGRGACGCGRVQAGEPVLEQAGEMEQVVSGWKTEADGREEAGNASGGMVTGSKSGRQRLG